MVTHALSYTGIVQYIVSTPFDTCVEFSVDANEAFRVSFGLAHGQMPVLSSAFDALFSVVV